MEFKIHVSSESSMSSNPNNSPSKFKTIFHKPITLSIVAVIMIGALSCL